MIYRKINEKKKKKKKRKKKMACDFGVGMRFFFFFFFATLYWSVFFFFLTTNFQVFSTSIYSHIILFFFRQTNDNPSETIVRVPTRKSESGFIIDHAYLDTSF